MSLQLRIINNGTATDANQTGAILPANGILYTELANAIVHTNAAGTITAVRLEGSGINTTITAAQVESFSVGQLARNGSFNVFNLVSS